MPSGINAEQFLEAFRRVDNEQAAEFDAGYTNFGKRTNVILGKDGYLESICRDLESAGWQGMEYKREWYTLDALFVSGQDLLYPGERPDRGGNRLRYPSRLDVLIEHENGERLEEEMWKLLFWRADLKVLIGYDYCEDEFDQTLGKRFHGRVKRDWAPGKLEQLRDMVRQVHGEEGDGSEYILIFGNRASWKHTTRTIWRWARVDQTGAMLQVL